MKPDNPAVYECVSHRYGIHTWKRNDDGTATCLNCNKRLTRDQATDALLGFTDLPFLPPAKYEPPTIINVPHMGRISGEYASKSNLRMIGTFPISSDWLKKEKPQ